MGLLLGGTAWAWQRSAGNHLTVGMVKMQGDGVVMMGKEAANALAKGSPEALRDLRITQWTTVWHVRSPARRLERTMKSSAQMPRPSPAEKDRHLPDQ